ncbi:hypothetical protein BDR05DRAFT_1015181, partial [Suillus weaverae]
SHSHSPSHSQSSHHSQGWHGHSQSHGHSHCPSVPMLSTPQYALTPSPTSSEFSMFGHGHTHKGCEREKRQRSLTGSIVSVGNIGSSMGGSPMISFMGGGSVTGLGSASMGGEEDDEGEMSLSLSLDLDLDMDVGGSGGEKKQQQRTRSNSVPMWVTGQNTGASATTTSVPPTLFLSHVACLTWQSCLAYWFKLSLASASATVHDKAMNSFVFKN